jgi:hypothetical protein
MTVSMPGFSDDRVSTELQTKLNRQLSLIIETNSIYESKNGTISSSPSSCKKPVVSYNIGTPRPHANDQTPSGETTAPDEIEEDSDSEEPFDYMLMSLAARLPDKEAAAILDKAKRREGKYERLRQEAQKGRRDSPRQSTANRELRSMFESMSQRDASEDAAPVIHEAVDAPLESSAAFETTPSSPSAQSTAAAGLEQKSRSGSLSGLPPPAKVETVLPETGRIAPLRAVRRSVSGDLCSPPPPLPVQSAPSLPSLPAPRVWSDYEDMIVKDTGADRLAGIRQNRRERSCCRFRPSMSVMLACCGLMYSLQGHGQVFMERVGLGDLLSGSLGVSKLTLQRTSVGGFSLDQLETVMPDFVYTGAKENETAEFEYLEAAVARTKARADVRKRSLEATARASLACLAAGTFVVLLFALSFWRRIIGAVIAVGAGAILFIMVIIASDALRSH